MGDSISRSASAAVPCLYGVRRYFAASSGPERSRCDRLSSSFPNWTFRRAQSDKLGSVPSVPELLPIHFAREATESSVVPFTPFHV